MSYMDVRPRSRTAGPSCSCTARLLRRHLGGRIRHAARCRLRVGRAGPGRLLQIDQAGAPISLACTSSPPTRACCSQLGVEKADHHGPFHGRHAGDALCPDVSPGDVGSCSSTHRPGGWKAKGMPFAPIDQLYARAAGPPSTASSSTSSGPTTAASGSPSTTAGSPCWPHVPGRRRQAGGLEPGADLRHDLHPAGRLRARADRGPDTPADRPEGHHRHRQEPRRRPRRPRRSAITRRSHRRCRRASKAPRS